jgi:hypothetical protein
VKSWLDSQGISIAIRPSIKQDAVENVALAPVKKEKAEKPKELTQSSVEEKKMPPAEELKPAQEMKKTAEAEPELTKPVSTPPKKATEKKVTSKTKPKSKHEKPMAKAEDGLREFKGPSGEVMYGIPDGKFSLNDTQKMLYDRTRKNALKAFDELDEAQ